MLNGSNNVNRIPATEDGAVRMTRAVLLLQPRFASAAISVGPADSGDRHV